MPRLLRNTLTPLAVKSAPPGRHVDGAGLHLLVKGSGARSWVFRFMRGGASRDIGLGAAAGPNATSLAAARDAASALRLKVRSGIDPIVERQEAAREAKGQKREGATFRAVAEGYIAANENSWRNDKHRRQWVTTLETYAYPFIGEMPVAEIATADIVQVLKPIWTDKAETASRLRGRIEAVLDAAKVHDFRSGENPARWRGHLEHLLPARGRLTRGHHKAMPYAQVPEFAAGLGGCGAAAQALEFTILTAARTGEVLGAKWEEVDLNKGVWTVPAPRMKAGKEHRVPLAPRACEILRTLQPLGEEWLFPSSQGGGLSQMAMTMVMRRLNVDYTVHGFRSSFRDWAAEQTDYAHEVAEMALAHTIESKIERAYRRGDLFDKRRMLMLDWARFCNE